MSSNLTGQYVLPPPNDLLTSEWAVEIAEGLLSTDPIYVKIWLKARARLSPPREFLELRAAGDFLVVLFREFGMALSEGHLPEPHRSEDGRVEISASGDAEAITLEASCSGLPAGRSWMTAPRDRWVRLLAALSAHFSDPGSSPLLKTHW